MPPETRATAAPWYAQGLRFQCTRCGNCCTGPPGTVRVSDAEIERLAARLEMSDAEFRAVYTGELRGGDISLRERSDGSCVFHEPGDCCNVYRERSRQCRSWPFWGSVVHSHERWSEESADCPGMNRGPLHDAAAIATRAAGDGTRGDA